MKVTVDGIELDVAPGTSVIDAVFAAGNDVPYFCSQEYMSPIGACRMCLARVGSPRKDQSGNWMLDDDGVTPKVFWFPNLMATCTAVVSEGMVVDTRSADVKKAQGLMVELTLINHPLDCPVCDKGGACELQDRSYEYGDGISRFEFDKRHQEKHHALSELITLDRERCIHCKRCVRYFEEVPGDEVLDFIERGSHTYIGTEDEGLPSNFTGNITDICPVGALLDATSRFRGRNWEYHHTLTTSMDDASGSAIVVDARTGRIERIKAALNPEVNKTWIDDGTRFGHEYTDDPERLLDPRIRRGGELVSASWEDAAAFIAERLRGLSGQDVGIAIRADSTLEEGVAALALAEAVGTGQVDHVPRPAGGVISSRRATLEELATSDAILVVGDVTEEAGIVDLRIKDALKGVTPPALLPHGVPIADLRLKERAPRNRSLLTVAAPYRVDLMSHAGTELLFPPGREAALLDLLTQIANGVVSGSGEPDGAGADSDGMLGDKLAAAKASVARLKAAQRAVIVAGGGVLASQAGASALDRLAAATGAKVVLVGPMANSFGLELLGVTPNHPRFGYQSMLTSAKALFLSHLDPAQDPDLVAVLKDKELLVVHDSFLTDTAVLADVVLPARSVYERDGTILNLEGRVLPVRAAPVEAGTSEDLTGVAKALGEAMGQRLEGRSVRSARRALAKLFDFDLADLPRAGVVLAQTPARPRKQSGETAAAPETASAGNMLIAPSMVRGEYLLRNRSLRAARGGPTLRVNPADATAHGLHDGVDVRLRAGGLWRHATVKVTDEVRPGLMTLPSLPDQPQGLVNADLSTLVVERERGEPRAAAVRGEVNA